ncbi:hypothetical protein [Leptospira noguchii]|uniref:Putative lipoprotein n=1 Tax=Leptospira noguchii TaxID=28182 RepID=M6VFP1_9LEPT|nr:hypothetical protein [Leptospira noguchii]EMO51944.1 putative lipoprotein [Leptospira noguchii]
MKFKSKLFFYCMIVFSITTLIAYVILPCSYGLGACSCEPTRGETFISSLLFLTSNSEKTSCHSITDSVCYENFYSDSFSILCKMSNSDVRLNEVCSDQNSVGDCYIDTLRLTFYKDAYTFETAEDHCKNQLKGFFYKNR